MGFVIFHRRFGHTVGIFAFCFILLLPALAVADVKSDLELLRNQCLYFAIGRAPNDANTKTIRHGLYGHSPFSPPAEIDIATSGFSLAALPLAVKYGLVSYQDANQIAVSAGMRIKQMVENSNNATTIDEIVKYGYKGMLHHYQTWSEVDNAFNGNVGTEISSIDTTLLMFGFLICAEYFQGQVLVDYEATVHRISWRDWIDSSNNQFRMAYFPQSGFSGWWDVRTDEVMLICLFAAMSDQSLDVKTLWAAWRKEIVTYTPPVLNPPVFTTYATWNGDPFTIFYGLQFIKFGSDFNGINWFTESRTAYHGHVEFFKTERGYLDNMVLAFTDNSQGVIAEPKMSPDEPITKTISPVYGIAGGLEFYSEDPGLNEIAGTLSLLIQNNNDFFQWTGWPCESVVATDSNHQLFSDYIIGQNISATAIMIDNYLTNGWLRNLVLQNTEMKNVIKIVFPLLGDINSDDEVDLKDVIMGVQMLAGMEPTGTVDRAADVNDDDQIGIEEVIYILQDFSNKD